MVSICVPAYNCIDDIKRLMDSVYAQDYTDFEVIVSDDSTNDEIEKYITGLKDDRIIYTHNETPLGHVFNWNKALDGAHGEYIKIMFADDWFNMKDSLSRFVHMLDDNDDAVMAFSSNMQVETKHPENAYYRDVPDEYIEKIKRDFRYLFVSNQIGAPSTTIFRKSANVRFDEKSNFASDVFLYFELLKNNGKFVCTRDPLVCIGIHDEQYTNTFDDADGRRIEDYRYLFTKYSLIESNECKEFFLSEYLLEQLKSKKYAAECGYDPAEYSKALRKAKIQRLCFYLGVIKKKLDWRNK